MNPILIIKDLSKSFEGLKLFDTVNISLPGASINCLFGGNGSGKTTFFNMLGGFVKPDSGSIHFNGSAIKYHSQSTLARIGIAKMWQEPMIFPNHTVLQNLIVCEKKHPGEHLLNYVFYRSRIRKTENELRDKAMRVLARFRLNGRSDDKAGQLSLGERKLLNISMLLMNEAQLLLLDEPFSGVNPDTIDKMSEALLELKYQGKTIFMIEHKINYALRISDNSYKVVNYKIENTVS
jgi:neutral amino acid transport system ATP-binding protein